MDNLAYSLHLGSDKNKKNISRNKGKNNISKSTNLSNNAIQNKQQLSKVDNHNYRKYDNDIEDIRIIKGSNSAYYDVEMLYKKEFEEARLEYNSKQTRPSRMIDNYFENVSNNEKKDLACEIIIELGDKQYWDTKDRNFKFKMYDVFYEQVNDLEKLVPNFKIASAVIHFDETSPHLHIVGVPIKDKQKNGMSKQVGKSDVFTKDSLTKLQDQMRDLCIKSFNKYYNLDSKLKIKQKGRNKDINVSAMNNYQELKKEIDIHTESINKTKKQTQVIKTNINDVENIFRDAKKEHFNKYYISSKDKEKVLNYIKEMREFINYYEDMLNMTEKFNILVDDLKYQKKINKNLKDNNDALISQNKKYDKTNSSLNDSLEFIKSYNKAYVYDLIRFINKNINSNDKNKALTYKSFSQDMYKRGLLKKAEYKLCLRPLFNYSNDEIENAIKNINKELDEAAEQFYTQKNDDYLL